MGTPSIQRVVRKFLKKAFTTSPLRAPVFGDRVVEVVHTLWSVREGGDDETIGYLEDGTPIASFDGAIIRFDSGQAVFSELQGGGAEAFEVLIRQGYVTYTLGEGGERNNYFNLIIDGTGPGAMRLSEGYL